MLQITHEFKTKVFTALQEARKNYTGSDSAFAKAWNTSPSVYARLKNGEIEGLVKEGQWLEWALKLDISPNERKWNMARTAVFNIIEEDIVFCQTYSKSKIFVDECAIGKSYAANYLSRTRRNCFYVDASQAATKIDFIRLLAQTIGLNNAGKWKEVKTNIKKYLKMLPNPLIIIDEAGDLQNDVFLLLKELWNATQGVCGWYMIGAVGLKTKIATGIRNEKPGFEELFSRYSDRYTSVVPVGKEDRLHFYRKLISDVLKVNMSDQTKLDEIVKRCLVDNGKGQISGLRRAESLLILLN